MAQGADVKILTAGAMKAVVLELVPQFEKETGHKAVVDNDTAGGLARRIEGGETFDLADHHAGRAQRSRRQGQGRRRQRAQMLHASASASW